MSDTGMFRRVDDLGRIVLPAELRKTLDLKEGTMLDIFLDDGRIILSPRRESCVFCSSQQDLKEFRSRMVCSSCAGEFDRGQTTAAGGASSKAGPDRPEPGPAGQGAEIGAGASWEPFAQP